jgi:hypothetical protein
MWRMANKEREGQGNSVWGWEDGSAQAIEQVCNWLRMKTTRVREKGCELPTVD